MKVKEDTETWTPQTSVNMEVALLQELTEKLKEKKSSMNAQGTIDTGTAAEVAAAAASTGMEDLPVCFPIIKLDVSHCNDECLVGDEGCSLTNEPHYPPPSPIPAFEFMGTSGTMALPMHTCYWQVACEVLPNPTTANNCWFCEVGVACLADLHDSEDYIDDEDRNSLTVMVKSSEGSVWMDVHHCGESVDDTELAPFDPNDLINCTLGFLLVAHSQRLVVIDVDNMRVLCDRQMNMSKPLWPCFNLVDLSAVTQAVVKLFVDSGPQLNLTPALVSLILTLLKGPTSH